MMLDEALRPPRQSFLLGPSTVFCVAAHAPAHPASALHVLALDTARTHAPSCHELADEHELSQVPKLFNCEVAHSIRGTCGPHIDAEQQG